jgi:hypothetical protein
VNLFIGFNENLQTMNTSKINEVTIFLMKVREVTAEHLPISHSIIPYQILLVVMYYHIRNDELSVKQLFNSGAFSEMGNRYHFKKLIQSDWIILKEHPKDFRLKLIKPSEKLMMAFASISEQLPL